MKKYTLPLLTLLLSIMASSAFAVPPKPWLAVAEGAGLGSRGSCLNTAKSVLKQQGFVRVNHTGNTVMGAYRSGRNYGYKVAVKCVGGEAVAFVVTTLSGKGLAKANSIIAAMRNQSGSMEESDDEDLDNEEYDEDDEDEEGGDQQ